jgi:hypothetical protein
MSVKALLINYEVINLLSFVISQNTLNALERDCDEIGSQVDLAIEEDNQAR